jgi:uncharacterized protein YndB with AHSA1/START domain
MKQIIAKTSISIRLLSYSPLQVGAFIHRHFLLRPLCLYQQKQKKTMKTLEYKINIDASVKKVWEKMLSPDTYREWVAASWPGSFYKGEWKQGEKISFVGNDESGTLAKLVEVKPHQSILAEHIAVLQPGGIEDRDSEVAKGWVGGTEKYNFRESNGETELLVTIKTNPAWEQMFNDGWPAALEELKRICEN